MIPIVIHRYEIGVQEAIEALLGSAVADCEGWHLKVEGDTLVVHIIEPAGRPVESRSAGLEAPLEPASATPKEETPPKQKRKGGPLAQKAGILCNEGAFRAWAEVSTPDAAKAFIYNRCGISTRIDLDYEEEPARIFREMAREYDLWLSAPE